jgi:hypothetical protein
MSLDDRRRARRSNGGRGNRGDDEYREAVDSPCLRGIPGAVDDAAQAWPVGWPGRAAGSFGSVACVTSAMLPTTRALLA